MTITEQGRTYTPVEYLEKRVRDLRLERPLTVGACVQLEHTIHELQNCIFALKIQELDDQLKATRAECEVLQ